MTTVADDYEHDYKFYNAWFCPFAQRAWIALLEKGVDFEYIEVNPYEKTPEWLAISPRGLVPALVDHGQNIYESQVLARYAVDGRVEYGLQKANAAFYAIKSDHVLLEYIEEKWSGRMPPLMPRSPGERARCRIWCDHVSKRIVPPFYQMLMKPETYPESSKAFMDAVKEFDPKSSPIWSRHKNWFDAMMREPGVNKTVAERHALIDKYQRYADNTAQSKVADAVRAGKALP